MWQHDRWNCGDRPQSSHAIGKSRFAVVVYSQSGWGETDAFDELAARRERQAFVMVVAHPPDTVSEIKALAITEEPEGGSPQPTSAIRWVGAMT